MANLDVPSQEQALTALGACACQHFRTASRAVTQLYDQTLAPTGLRSTQLVVLLAVAAYEPVSPSTLASELAMDRTTLARNTQPLERAGLLTHTGCSEDRRRRLLTLTDTGREAIADAVPLWQQAQQRFIQSIGDRQWSQLKHQLAEAHAAVRKA